MAYKPRILFPRELNGFYTQNLKINDKKEIVFYYISTIGRGKSAVITSINGGIPYPGMAEHIKSNFKRVPKNKLEEMAIKDTSGKIRRFIKDHTPE